MKTLGNIIWVIFGGLHIALEYFIAGLILMITIIGIPFGKMHFRLAKLALSPFGKELVYYMSKDEKRELRRDLAAHILWQLPVLSCDIHCLKEL